MKKYEWYWHSNKDWYFRRDDGVQVVRDDAPEEAKRSYQIYLEQIKSEEAKLRKIKS